jgi:hypothetical protein
MRRPSRRIQSWERMLSVMKAVHTGVLLVVLVWVGYEGGMQTSSVGPL